MPSPLLMCRDVSFFNNLPRRVFPSHVASFHPVSARLGPNLGPARSSGCKGNGTDRYRDRDQGAGTRPCLPALGRRSLSAIGSAGKAAHPNGTLGPVLRRPGRQDRRASSCYHRLTCRGGLENRQQWPSPPPRWRSAFQRASSGKLKSIRGCTTTEQRY